MPSSSVRTFTDPDEYAVTVRPPPNDGPASMTLIGSGNFTGKLVRIDLHRLWMQRFYDNLPRIGHAANMVRRATIMFRTEGGSELFHNGQEMAPNSIKHSHADDYHGRTSGPINVGLISLPLEDMASASVIGGVDLMLPRDPVLITPPTPSLARLHRLHKAAGDLAGDAPAVLAHPEAARGLEQAIIEATVHCFDSGEAHEDRAAQRQHAAIMQRFHRVVEEHLDEPLYITELCKEVGASERTLNTCCHEHLGMGPKHFLLLRRMHMVRRALREGNPTETSVTEIAVQFGFWQFGRLAVAYKALFGEAPSTTLARPV